MTQYSNTTYRTEDWSCSTWAHGGQKFPSLPRTRYRTVACGARSLARVHTSTDRPSGLPMLTVLLVMVVAVTTATDAAAAPHIVFVMADGESQPRARSTQPRCSTNQVNSFFTKCWDLNPCLPWVAQSPSVSDSIFHFNETSS